jgi:hypothetical protein
MNYEAVRTATLALCEEMLRQRKGLDARESEEVRVRMRALGRLELVWSGSDIPMNESAISLGASGTETGTSTSMVGEERVQRLFARALRDGYVLCQYVCPSGLWPLCLMDRNADTRLMISSGS